MTRLDTAPFKALLLQQRSTLLAQLSTLRGGDVGRAQASTEHFASRDDTPAAANSARDLEFALDAHDSAEIAAVNAALQRMDDGQYGDCVDCGDAITEARLLAAPEAARCIHCQQQWEKAHRS